jgi:hypothetical protein
MPIVFVVGFDLTDRETFNQIPSLVQSYQAADPNAKIILVGTNADELLQTVTPYEAEDMADRLRCSRYIEFSTKRPESLDALYQAVAESGVDFAAPARSVSLRSSS